MAGNLYFIVLPSGLVRKRSMGIKGLNQSCTTCLLVKIDIFLLKFLLQEFVGVFLSSFNMLSYMGIGMKKLAPPSCLW